MKESYGEGLAPHTDPESCVGNREVVGEALTGARTGQPLSCEIRQSGTPTLLSEAEGHTNSGAKRESLAGPAQSETLCTCGNSSNGNREIPEIPSLDGGDGRLEKAGGHNSDMYVSGKSDGRIVSEKSPNKSRDDLLAEGMERRRPTKGNAEQPATIRTRSRKIVSTGLQRVREVARKGKDVRFTALLHHVTPELLEESFFQLKKTASPGVDGMTWAQYQENLAERLSNLHERVHKGTYRAQPSRRVYISKADGRLRPLGVASLEDKIVQHAVGEILTVIYEEAFLGFSYGFRPGRSQHDALDALTAALYRKKVNWVLDADIQGFFDTISHEWMLRLLEHRIADKRILRLVKKWLRAGVSEDGEWSRTDVGTPQGAVISPLLANIYLHYVLDLWVQHGRKQARGDVIIVRFADDVVLGFQYQHDAQNFLSGFTARLGQFGLTLHPEKTRLIEFGRFAAEDRQRRGEGRPETFEFLGFTHICGRTRDRKRFKVCRLTMKKRLRTTLKRVKQELRWRMHDPIPEVGRWLRSVVIGYDQYHAIPGNGKVISSFRYDIKCYWYKVLRRRGQKRRINWKAFGPIVTRWIPAPKILHPHPLVRFDAKYLR